AAVRTLLRRLHDFRTLRPLLQNRLNDLRDDVTGLLNNDSVTNSNVLSANLINVVKRRMLHRGACDEDRRERGARRERPALADLPIDLLELRDRLLRRVLVRNAPTRCFAGG